MVRHFRTQGWFKFLTLAIVATSMSMLTGCAALKNLAQNGELANILSKVGVDLNKVTGSDAKTEIGGQVVEYNDITGESTGIPFAEVTVAIGSTTVTDWADDQGAFRVLVGDISTANSITVTAKLDGQYQSNSTTLKLGTDYSPGYEYVGAGSIVLQPILGSTTSGRISGSVFYGPLPLSGVTITAHPTSGSDKSVKTSSSGFYVLTGLAEGTYKLSASLTDFSTKAGPDDVAVELNQTVTGNDFFLEPIASAASKYSIKDLGVIKAEMVGNGQSAGSPLPGFILSASATLITAKTNDNQEIKTFIDPQNSSFTFRGVPVGKHKVKVTIKMDPQKFVQDQKTSLQTRQSNPMSGIQELSCTYDVTSVALPSSGSLDSIQVQKVSVKDSDFGFDKFFSKLNQNFNTNINLNFSFSGGPNGGNGTNGGVGQIWIEQDVMLRVGSQQNPMTEGFVEMVPASGETISTWFQNGHFGMGLAKSGAYTLKVYNVDSDGNKTGDPLLSKSVTVPAQMFDPRGWHVGPIFITGSADTIIKDLAAVPVSGRIWIESFNGPVDSSLSDGLEMALTSVAVPSYSVTLNITKQDSQSFQFSANVKPLGQFKAVVLAGALAIRDPLQNYFVDKFNQPNLDIGLRSNAVSSRVSAQFGNQEYGLEGATVRLLKDGVRFGSAVTTKAGFSVRDGVEGSFSLSMPSDPSLIGSSKWVLQIAKPGTIATKNISVTFRNNNGVLESNLGQIQSIKVTPTQYFGPNFGTLSGRLTCFDTPGKVANVPITLQYDGMTVTFSATTDSLGNFTFEDVPALGGQIRIAVTSGSDLGQTDWTFIDQRMADAAINGINSDAAMNFPLNVNFTGFKINSPVNIQFAYNNNTYPVAGATLNIQSNDDASVSMNMLADDFGNIGDVYIPKDGSYTVRAMKGSVIKTLDRLNLRKNDMNRGWNNTNIVITPASDAQLRALAQSVTVNGYVKTASGAAISGAKVEFKAANASFVASVNTTSDGQYSISVPKIGDYRISATKTGFDRPVNNMSLQPFNLLTDTTTGVDLIMNPQGSGDSYQLSDIKVVKTVTKTADSFNATGTTATSITVRAVLSKNGTAVSDLTKGVIRVLVLDSSRLNAVATIAELTNVGSGVFEGQIPSTYSSGTQFVLGVMESGALVYPNASQYAASRSAFSNLIVSVPESIDVPSVTSITVGTDAILGKSYTIHAHNNNSYFGAAGNPLHRLEITFPGNQTFVVRGMPSLSLDDVAITYGMNQTVQMTDGSFQSMDDIVGKFSGNQSATLDTYRLIISNQSETSFAILSFRYATRQN